MRIVYCKCDSVEIAKETAKAFKGMLERRNIEVNTINDKKLTCNGYDVSFLCEKEVLELQATRPGTAYLCIPYNRILLSQLGVNPEKCNLKGLLECIENDPVNDK